jgi:hypothetical protein
MKKIGWTLPLILYSVALPLSWLGGVFWPLLILTIPLCMVALVFDCIMHYRCWDALSPSQRRTTPGKAVGFLFIPFYNFYWVFVSYRGLAIDLGRATGKPDAGGLGTTMAILYICQWVFIFVPVLSALVGIAYFILWILFTRLVVGQANSLLSATGSTPPPLIAAHAA